MPSISFRCVKRTLAIALVPLLAFVALSECAASNEIKWTEEVRLHDGTVVQVNRRTELSTSGFPHQKRGFPKYFGLCYRPLGATWVSKPQYQPRAFDIVDGKAYVKVFVTGCTECTLQGYPATDALYFRWDGGSWTQVGENEDLRRLRFNLLEAIYASNDDKHDARGLITLADKERRDASIYSSMKATGRTGPFAPGACEKCKATWGAVKTDRSSEVLLPPESKACN